MDKNPTIVIEIAPDTTHITLQNWDVRPVTGSRFRMMQKQVQKAVLQWKANRLIQLKKMDAATSKALQQKAAVAAAKGVEHAS